MEAIKYEDIKGDIQEVTSENSQSSGRHIVNENFKKFSLTIESVWNVLDAIYNTDSESLGPIDLHSDVSTSGINSPAVGNGLLYDGILFKPALIGAGSGGASFLTELLDVEAFSYPLPEGAILKYDLGNNRFEPAPNDILNLANNNLSTSVQNEVLIKSSTDILDSIPAGSDDTFLSSNGGNIGFSYLTLSKINDLDVPASPSTTTYGLHFNGVSFELKALDDLSGIKFIIGATEVITVDAVSQYIVHDHLYLDGEMDIEGELIIL